MKEKVYVLAEFHKTDFDIGVSKDGENTCNYIADIPMELQQILTETYLKWSSGLYRALDKTETVEIIRDNVFNSA